MNKLLQNTRFTLNLYGDIRDTLLVCYLSMILDRAPTHHSM